MKTLFSLFLICAASCQAHVNVNGNGTYTVDQYGDNWQKKPSDKEMDPSPKNLISGLSKKKSSDIVIYPIPRM